MIGYLGYLCNLPPKKKKRKKYTILTVPHCEECCFNVILKMLV